MNAALIALALLLDAVMGEPERLWRRVPHPAVLMGRAVSALDRALNAGSQRKRRGVVAVAILVLGATALGLGVGALPGGPLLELVGAAILLAQKSLSDHVSAVAAGLRHGLAEGRAAVARIVGRDPESLDEPAVARAAVESAAESFSDGVVAPAFWFLLGGLPGMLVYKAVNTADSMIGHRDERYAEFGWAAARLDDLMNIVPARLAALLLALAARRRAAFRIAFRDGRKHASPNAGWPEAAMAGALGLALNGPRVYGGEPLDAPWLNAEARRDASPDDIDAAVRLLWAGWRLLVALTMIVALAVG